MVSPIISKKRHRRNNLLNETQCNSPLPPKWALITWPSELMERTTGSYISFKPGEPRRVPSSKQSRSYFVLYIKKNVLKIHFENTWLMPKTSIKWPSDQLSSNPHESYVKSIMVTACGSLNFVLQGIWWWSNPQDLCIRLYLEIGLHRYNQVQIRN